jgi:hypothetical protein
MRDRGTTPAGSWAQASKKRRGDREVDSAIKAWGLLAAGLKATDRNRRASNHRSALALIPLENLFSGREDLLVSTKKSSSASTDASHDLFDQVLTDPVVVSLQRRPGPDHPHWKIPPAEWQTVLQRIDLGESLRTVAAEYGVSYEAVRRVVRAARQHPNPGKHSLFSRTPFSSTPSLHTC